MAALDISKKKETAQTEIPDYLVYEMYKGQPIYYKGYRDVLNGTKTFEQNMGDMNIAKMLE